MIDSAGFFSLTQGIKYRATAFLTILTMVVFSKFSHAGNVLANDVEFQIDCTANLDCVEIGVVVSVWYYAYLKGVCRWVAYGQADTVDGD